MQPFFLTHQLSGLKSLPVKGYFQNTTRKGCQITFITLFFPDFSITFHVLRNFLTVFTEKFNIITGRDKMKEIEFGK